MNEPGNSWKQYLPLLLFVLSICGYTLIGYFLNRTDGLWLMTVYSFLFFAYLICLKHLQTSKQFQWATFMGWGMRLVLIISVPSLSDDFYRFIWDGYLVNAGENPYVFLPGEYIKKIASADLSLYNSIFQHLNSPYYFSIYPPVNQFVFWLATMPGFQTITGPVIIIRLVLIGGEAGTFWVIKNLLSHYRLPKKNLFIYFLNPLVILEICGNLHFEGLVILFVLTFIYLLHHRYFPLSSVALALAISTKLIPALFIPFYFRKLPVKKAIMYIFITTAISAITFIPFIDSQFIHGLGESLTLYFNKFEFNGSIYYLVRWVGYLAAGFNIIEYAGPALACITLILITTYIFQEIRELKNPLPIAFLFTLSIYLIFTTTLHPWYITPIIALCIFTRFRYPIIWSWLIFFTYLSYNLSGVQENLYVIGGEYLLLAGFILLELKNNPLNRRLQNLIFD